MSIYLYLHPDAKSVSTGAPHAIGYNTTTENLTESATGHRATVLFLPVTLVVDISIFCGVYIISRRRVMLEFKARLKLG